MEIIGGLELETAELVLLTEFEILKHFSLGAERLELFSLAGSQVTEGGWSWSHELD